MHADDSKEGIKQQWPYQNTCLICAMIVADKLRVNQKMKTKQASIYDEK